jgi:hypothetical protein
MIIIIVPWLSKKIERSITKEEGDHEYPPFLV